MAQVAQTSADSEPTTLEVSLSDGDLIRLHDAILSHATTKKTRGLVQVFKLDVSSDPADAERISDVVDVLLGSLAERDFSRLVVCLEGRGAAAVAAQLGVLVPTVCTRELGALPPNWAVFSIVEDIEGEDAEYSGIEVEDSTIISSTLQHSTLRAKGSLSWPDFLHNYAHLLAPGMPKSKIRCLDPEVYPETESLLANLSQKGEVIILESPSAQYYILHDSTESSLFLCRLDDGSTFVQSVLHLAKPHESDKVS